MRPHCDPSAGQQLVKRMRREKPSQSTALRCAKKQCKHLRVLYDWNLLHMVVADRDIVFIKHHQLVDERAVHP